MHHIFLLDVAILLTVVLTNVVVAHSLAALDNSIWVGTSSFGGVLVRVKGCGKPLPTN